MKTKFIIFSIIVIFSSCSKKYSFKNDIETAYKQGKELNIIPKEQIQQILSDTTQNSLIVDIRTVGEFGEGRLPNAISIPLKNLYNNLNFFFLNRDKKIFIYAENTSIAVSTTTYLRSIGLENIYAIGGGYKYIYENFINKQPNANTIYFDETPKYHYAAKFKELSKGNSTNNEITTQQTTPTVIPVKQTKKTGLGGCG